MHSLRRFHRPTLFVGAFLPRLLIIIPLLTALRRGATTGRFGSLGLLSSCSTPLCAGRAVLQLLPPGALVAFYVRPDGHGVLMHGSIARLLRWWPLVL